MDALTNAMRRLGRTIPGVPQTYHLLRHWYVRYKSRNLDPAAEFAAIFHAGTWGGKDSVSGPGSEPDQTGVLLRELPALFRELQVSTVLDLPCGDFHWMRDVDLSGVAYTGGDVVEEIIQRNRERYRRDNVVFQRLDLLGDDLPPADLVTTSDAEGNFYIDFRALELGELVADVKVHPPEPQDTFSATGMVLEMALHDEHRRFLARWGVGEHILYVGEVQWADGTAAQGVGIEFRRTGGLAIQPEVLQTTTGANGRFGLHPTSTASGTVVGDLFIRPGPPQAEVVVRGVQLASFADDSPRFYGIWWIPRP
jgi:hypothetical protein